MSEYTTQVGMDVHARSVSCKALRPETGECWSKTFSGDGHEHELLEWLKKLPGPVRCSYESGCTGFWLSRFLERGGVACDVMAVSTIPRSPKNRKHKDDRHDAGVVLREMCNPASDVSYVWVPDPEVEGARDLARAADSASRVVRSAKQRGCMLLVKHGFVWNERTESGNLKKTWTPAWKKWARSCDLGDPMSNMALEMEIEFVERMERADPSEGHRHPDGVPGMRRVRRLLALPQREARVAMDRLHVVGGLHRRQPPPGRDHQGGQLVSAPRARRGHLVDIAPDGAQEVPPPGTCRVAPGRGHRARG